MSGQDRLAYVALAVFTIINLTAFRFQRFSRSIAGDLVFGPNGSRDPNDVSTLQSMMTPWWLGALLVASYCFLVLAAFAGFPARGWLWVVALVVWAALGAGLLSPFWVLPTRGQCLAMARREKSSSMGRFTSTGEERRSTMRASLLVQLMASKVGSTVRS